MTSHVIIFSFLFDNKIKVRGLMYVTNNKLIYKGFAMLLYIFFLAPPATSY